MNYLESLVDDDSAWIRGRDWVENQEKLAKDEIARARHNPVFGNAA